MMTQEEAYGCLSPFIQDYIYHKKWNALSNLQLASIEAIQEGRHNLILTAGTASGKTEAAFLPCISKIENVRKSVGILYISPLKALINDQFERIEDMLKGSGISITKWHGDISVSHKMKLLEEANGILQTTPESLEAMFCLHPERINSLFSSLQYIIIDEIHYFINDPRGIQLRILLERIERRIKCSPIHIGLSATLKDHKAALEYLKFASNRPGKVIAAKNAGRQTLCSVTSTRIGKENYPERFVRKLYRQVKEKRTLLFSNSRKDCELTIYQLKEYAKKQGEPDIFHLHHASISKDYREETEKRMKELSGPICTGTTMTLELGIDIGSLDEVVQTVAPLSISSMVQRIGRSGRRTGRSSISFQLKHYEDHGNMEELDLQLVRTIAMIELYFREGYMESLKMRRHPYGLLAHTILSVLCEKGCLQPKILAFHCLEISTFHQISQDDFRDILHTMIDKDYLKIYDDGAIGLSDAGEKMVNQMGFYSVFDVRQTMSVYYGSREIGNVDYPYPVGELFYLNGSIWQVINVDHASEKIDVVPSEGEASIRYSGNYSDSIDKIIMEKIHEILNSEETYRYLDEGTQGILDDSRKKWKKHHLDQEMFVEGRTGHLLLVPSLSTMTIYTIYHILKAHDIKCQEIYLRDCLYGIRIQKDSISKFKALCHTIVDEKHLIDYGYINSKVRYGGAFSMLLPDHLKAREIMEDQMDIEGARDYFKSISSYQTVS